MPLGRRPYGTIARPPGRNYDSGVRAYALVELGDSEAIDLFLPEEDAFAALEDALRDEPGWGGTLSVELDERNVSAN
jgi:hypothetical protein